MAAELFALYAGITSWGPAQFGNYNTIRNYFGKQPLDPIIGQLPGIDDLLAVYVRTDADAALDEILAHRSTACLVGRRHSGRYSTARAALARRYKPDSVYEIVLPVDVPPEALVDRSAEIPEHSGFILRLADGHADAMRKLAASFRKRNASLLLIKEAAPHRWEEHGAEVRHHPPDPIEVFRRQLAAQLPDMCADARERYLTEEVRAELKGTSGPKEPVALAHAIAQERPADNDAVQALLARSQSNRRSRAAAILLPSAEGPASRASRVSQHQRAFRLSYAVFHRRPLHYVFEAADLLLREIDSAALRPDWGNMALQHPVQELLGDRLGIDWEAGRTAGDSTAGACRTAWIGDAGLRGAIVDVAWHEFDGTRRPLLGWLNRLVTDGDKVMRQAAAEIAGLLLNHDFTQVHDRLVREWAGSRRADVRQAAAWAMTYADMSEEVGVHVRGALDDWCDSTSYRRDAAARVYASGLQQTALAWSLFDLARIARDRLQKRRHVVAEAINQLYRPELAGWLITELYGWARTPFLQVHAARALLALAAKGETADTGLADAEDLRDGPGATDGLPDLLVRLTEESVDVQHLGRLWLIAFLESETASLAAEALARWIRHADANHTIRRHVAGLLRAIGATPANRRRVAFYLQTAPEWGDGLPEWALNEGSKDS